MAQASSLCDLLLKGSDMGENQISDVLGIAPYGEALKAATEAAIQGVGNFLNRIVMPATEEFGLLLKDRVSYWRAINLKKITEKSKQLLGSTSNHAHPRLIAQIIENGSWSDDTVVQDMWAGLLSSSCTPDGKDDSNLFFINLLSQLTKSQARFLNYTCAEAPKSVDNSGLIVIGSFHVWISELLSIYEINDIHVIDRELDHLRALGLIRGGIMVDAHAADIAPTPLGLYMYVRCQGSLDSPGKYFRLE